MEQPGAEGILRLCGETFCTLSNSGMCAVMRHQKLGFLGFVCPVIGCPGGQSPTYECFHLRRDRDDRRVQTEALKINFKSHVEDAVKLMLLRMDKSMTKPDDREGVIEALPPNRCHRGDAQFLRKHLIKASFNFPHDVLLLSDDKHLFASINGCTKPVCSDCFEEGSQIKFLDEFRLNRNTNPRIAAEARPWKYVCGAHGSSDSEDSDSEHPDSGRMTTDTLSRLATLKLRDMMMDVIATTISPRNEWDLLLKFLFEAGSRGFVFEMDGERVCLKLEDSAKLLATRLGKYDETIQLCPSQDCLELRYTNLPWDAHEVFCPSHSTPYDSPADLTNWKTKLFGHVEYGRMEHVAALDQICQSTIYLRGN